MGAATITAMKREFGTEAKDLVCAIGPSICQDCYEVSEDVADAFKEAFPGHADEILLDKKNGKYQLDLWGERDRPDRSRSFKRKDRSHEHLHLL